MSYAMADKWNLITVPQYVTDPAVTTLFPTAQSHAFAYQGSYVVADSVSPGVAYWLKFDGTQTVVIYAQPMSSNSMSVSSGWNLIGAIAEPVPVSSIMQMPDSIVATHFYGYNNGYYVADTLMPGQGYWVKTNQQGSLGFFPGAVAAKRVAARNASISGMVTSRHGLLNRSWKGRAAKMSNTIPMK